MRHLGRSLELLFLLLHAIKSRIKSSVLCYFKSLFEFYLQSHKSWNFRDGVTYSPTPKQLSVFCLLVNKAMEINSCIYLHSHGLQHTWLTFYGIVKTWGFQQSQIPILLQTAFVIIVLTAVIIVWEMLINC